MENSNKALEALKKRQISNAKVEPLNKVQPVKPVQPQQPPPQPPQPPQMQEMSPVE